MLFFAVYVISKSQTTTELKFQEEFLKISNFTLHFTDLGFDGNLINEQIDELYGHLHLMFKEELKMTITDLKELPPDNLTKAEVLEKQKNFKEKIDKNDNLIYDINYPLIGQTELDVILEKNRISGERLKLEYALENLGEEKKEEKSKLEELIEKIEIQEKDLDEEYVKVDNSNFRKVNDAYITFHNTEDCEFIKNTYNNKSKFGRCCTIFCCQKQRIKHL